MKSDLWSIALQELRLQMTTATYNTWLVDTAVVEQSDDELVVAVRNAYAADWLQHRLIDTITRIVASIAGHAIPVRFIVAGGENVRAQTSDAPAAPLELAAPPALPMFPGFEPVRSNFTQVPRQFFEIVLRAESPVVTAFVAAVVDQTHGVITNYHTGERREWWEASYPEIGRVAGIRSLASVGKAISTSRANGYVIRAEGARDFRYRLRRFGEPVDDPIKK